MLRNLYLTFVAFALASVPALAQVGSGTLKGKLTDAKTGEPLPFVNIVVQSGERQVAGGATDFDGNYTIKPIAPGQYDVLVSYVGYNSQKIAGVIISNEKITFVNIKLESGISLETFEVIDYAVPLINKDGGSSGATITREDIAQMPGRSAQSIATTVAGVQENRDGQVSIRGAREENTFYYVDGIKVRGNTNMPKAAIQEVQVMTGGIPASYGDATGGIIAITTRGASSSFFGGIDILTSGFRNQDGGGVGLDAYANTQIEAVLSGPLLFKKDAAGNKERALLGFFLSGNFRRAIDTRPSAIGNFRLKSDVRDQLVQNPLNFVFNGFTGTGSTDVFIDENGQVQPAFVLTPSIQGNQSALFIRENDWERVDARQNAGFWGTSLTAKIDVATTPNIDLSFGGTFDFENRNQYSYNNSLLNFANNGETRNLNFRTFARFTQRFGSGDPTQQSESIIKNAFYSVMVDYEQRNFRQWDPRHQDNLFNYGHIGSFRPIETNNYTFRNDTTAVGFYHSGFRVLETQFTPSTTNADLASYTTALYNFYDQIGLRVRTIDDIDASGGLRNGRTPPSVYNLFTAIGTPFNTFRNFDQSQFRVTGSGSADVGKHAITLGFEFEQFTQRNFSVAPVGLWNAARQLANSHIQELNFAAEPEQRFINTDVFFTYPRLINLGSQTTFDRNLRTALGLNPNGDDVIYVDALNPSVFSLDMFSADELLNQGFEYVSYYGYDYKGNRLRGSRPTIDDFFNQRDANGNLTRPRGAFEPIYIAGYIMDKFAFDDIIFNVGVRVDRFDANQPVLKDQFVIGEAGTVADTRNPEARFFFNEHPSNVGENWVVYVNDLNSPTGVNGYRNGNTWYNAQGVEIPDPRVLRTAAGIAPYLFDPSAVGENLTPNAFRDYKPQVNIMPRVAFSFPISDEAVFFAHYDILTQRPTGQNIANPVDYLFIIQRGNDAIANPNLRPTRTTDYELGFQQVLSRSSSLKIAAFYRETRDEIQARRLLEAFPVTYTSFDNFDFGTIKGMSLTYDLRRTGNITLRANYTLQFASATGSNAESAVNLVNSGEPNLRVIFPTDRDQRHLFITTFDYRYRGGKDYNGPVINGKQVLANTGLNLVSTLGTGTPYSRQQQATADAFITGGGNRQLAGSVNGSRLPAQFRGDAQIDKNWQINFGKDGDKQKKAYLNTYLLINNLLNTRNIISVYRFTGNPDDDGYLNAPQFQPAILSQLDEVSFRQMYGLKVNAPGNYSVARTIQLGLRLDF
jgi:hypothetical protein